MKTHGGNTTFSEEWALGTGPSFKWCDEGDFAPSTLCHSVTWLAASFDDNFKSINLSSFVNIRPRPELFLSAAHVISG